MSLDYDQYLKEHIRAVNNALRWMIDNLNLNDLGFNDILMTDALWTAADHDKSKYDDAEYDAYDAYFYGGNRSYKVVQDFNYAWLHHIHNNPHHWQHWILVNDDPEEGTIALEMPLIFVLEMIADWWSFSWRQGKLDELFIWYADHEDHIMLHKNTRKLVEEILNRIQDKLEASELVNELGHSDLEEDKDKKYGLPNLKKFPMPDAAHVRSAIKFFNYATPQQEKTLAKAILERMEEYGMSFDDFEVGDENRFKNYIPKKEES